MAKANVVIDQSFEMRRGIAGAFVATYLGQAIGWYQAGRGAGFIGAVVGAIILLVIYRFVKR